MKKKLKIKVLKIEGDEINEQEILSTYIILFLYFLFFFFFFILNYRSRFSIIISLKNLAIYFHFYHL
jgi:hypothetical protein